MPNIYKGQVKNIVYDKFKVFASNMNVKRNSFKSKLKFNAIIHDPSKSLLNLVDNLESLGFSKKVAKNRLVSGSKNIYYFTGNDFNLKFIYRINISECPTPDYSLNIQLKSKKRENMRTMLKTLTDIVRFYYSVNNLSLPNPTKNL